MNITRVYYMLRPWAVCPGLAGYIRMLFFLILLMPARGHSQPVDESEYEPISVTLEIHEIGTADIPAMYRNKDLYLPVATVFDLLKVKNDVTPSQDSIRGFFLNEKDDFLFDSKTGRVFYQGKTYALPRGDLVRLESSLYMNLKYFDTVFGLEATFFFRRLLVTMTSRNELPLIREMRQDMMRHNLSRLKGDVKADTTIGRTYPFFHFGMADWAIMSAQQSEGQNQTTLNLGLGGVLAGGEFNASLNYYSQQAFSEKLQYYQWRYVNNDNAALRQVIAGKIFTQATASIYAPVVGIQFTNAPTVYRKSYGTYTLSQTTEPGWIVELYVNDVLVDYKKADASGFYSFEVPLIYGYTIIKLRFYGPYGEERTSLQYINIPFNFLPKHEMEYSVSGGIVEDGKSSRYSRVSLNYGLNNYITVGGGVEYLSSVTSGATMPFINSSVRLTPRLLVSGEYAYGVRGRGSLSYRFPSSLQLDLDYIKYAKGQTAIYYNYLEERKASLSLPIHKVGFSLMSRLTLDEITVPMTRYTNAEWAFTGSVKNVGFNLSTYASFVKESTPYLYSIGSVSFQLPAKIMFTGQVQYDYLTNSPVFMKYTFEKPMLGKGFFNLAYQEYFNANNRNVLVGFRYDFSFSRVSVSALTGNNNYYSRVEAASGSLIFDQKTHYANANNRTNVGKSGIVIRPYLDINCNGRRDPGEPLAQGLKVRINSGGRIIYSDKDTIIRILDLEPYVSYLVEMNSNSFDNIAWQLTTKTMRVNTNPNNFSVIDVPVSVVGEVSGIVSNKQSGTRKGLGQVVVSVYSGEGRQVARLLTESDGFFSYIGLAPGEYTAQLDSTQLRKLNYRAEPSRIAFHIAASHDGDIVDGLEFSVRPTAPDTAGRQAPAAGHPVYTVEKAQEQEPAHVLAEAGTFAIYIGFYQSRTTANAIRDRIHADLNLNTIVVKTVRGFEVHVIGFRNRKAARLYIPELIYEGYRAAEVRKLAEDIRE